MKIVDHTLRSELDNYFETYKIDKSKALAYKAWAMISGPQLSAVTELKNIKDGVLKVYSLSSSAKNLLLLRKTKIIKSYNEMYPNLNIVDIEIVKRS